MGLSEPGVLVRSEDTRYPSGMSPDLRLALDKLSMRSFDADGRLHVEKCNISKATVNPYYGREIPNSVQLGLDQDRIYNLYRDPDELAAAAPSFANLQLLLTHKGVSADDPSIDLTVGSIGTDTVFEAPYLKASLAIWTKEGIALVESKAQAQLSCSYRYRADMTPGVTPAGVAFDGVMRDIIGNHVALVEEGRAGPDVMVSDSLPQEIAMSFKFPKLAAALKALIPTVKDEQLLAFDAAACEEAKDAFPDKDDEEKKAKDAKEAEEKAAADKKAADEAEEEKKKKEAEDKARDEAAGVSPGPKDGERGAALDAAIKSAEDRAVARVEALHVAREEVKPLVGVIALDSAEAVYRFALDKAGVDVKGVHTSAYGSLVRAELRARAKTATPVRAFDAANSVGLSAIIPGLDRIKQG